MLMSDGRNARVIRESPLHHASSGTLAEQHRPAGVGGVGFDELEGFRILSSSERALTRSVVQSSTLPTLRTTSRNGIGVTRPGERNSGRIMSANQDALAGKLTECSSRNGSA